MVSQKLYFSNQIEKLLHTPNLKTRVKLWKIIKNVNFYQVLGHASILSITLIYLIDRPEMFAQVDQINELFQLQTYPSNCHLFLPEDAPELE